jgi:hypothetical protein
VRKALGRPKRCALAHGHAFRWEYSDKRLELAQILDKLGVFLTSSTNCTIREMREPVPCEPSARRGRRRAPSGTEPQPGSLAIGPMKISGERTARGLARLVHDATVLPRPETAVLG